MGRCFRIGERADQKWSDTETSLQQKATELLRHSTDVRQHADDDALASPLGDGGNGTPAPDGDVGDAGEGQSGLDLGDIGSQGGFGGGGPGYRMAAMGMPEGKPGLGGLPESGGGGPLPLEGGGSRVADRGVATPAVDGPL